MLQPMLKKKGTTGSFYSRKALSEICSVPRHLLLLNDECKPNSHSRQQHVD